MKYNKKPSLYKLKPFLFVGLLILAFSLTFKDIIYRSLVTINMGSLNVSLINTRSKITNMLQKNHVNLFEVSMSPNNYVRLQKERSIMSSNYVLTGDQWNSDNKYFKCKIKKNGNKSKAEIKLFGMNPDHYRSPKGFSFRLKYDGGKGFGNKKVNFINPRSRDYNTDFLSNIIFHEINDGIKINHELFKVLFNKSDFGYYLSESFFDKHLIEENERRESVIFEVIKDSIYFNHIGDDDEFLSLSNEIKDLKINDPDKFLNFFDIEKVKTILLISLIINDNHPLSGINLHWIHNPVNGLFEPTFREGFTYRLKSFDFNSLNFPPLINDLYSKFIQNDFEKYLKNNLPIVREIILNNSDYMTFKKKMVGFENQILAREKIILENIDIIQESLINSFKIENNYDNKVIHIKNDTLISENWNIKSNEKLIINHGVKITLKNVYLRILGGLQILGNENSKVYIDSPSGESSTIFIQSQKPVEISHTIFKNLSNKKSPYKQPASITFYKTSDIKISHTEFNSNISGDDFLNFFGCDNVNISNMIIKNTYSDALDSDFSNVKINNSIFQNIGNDALDGSGSKIIITNSKFLFSKDKAISAGEKSNFEIIGCQIINNEIGIVSKDESIVISKNNILNNNKLDLAVFKKKKIYSYPTFINKNTIFKNFLLEKKSNIKGVDNVIYTSNVEEKLYGNLYGRSTEK